MFIRWLARLKAGRACTQATYRPTKHGEKRNEYKTALYLGIVRGYLVIGVVHPVRTRGR
jgi:hypothetical protein